MAKIASPNSFADFPAIFPFDAERNSESSHDAISKVVDIAKKGVNIAKPIFYYASSNFGVAGMLASVYSRIAEKKDEKIFLQGNDSLAKLAKSILEKDEKLFTDVRTEKCLEKNAEDLEELYFTNAPKTSSFECSDNRESAENLKIIFAPQNTSEEQIKTATLIPLKSKNEPIKKPDLNKIYDITFNDLSFGNHSSGIIRFKEDQNIFINFENGTQWKFKILKGFLSDYRSGGNLVDFFVPHFADSVYSLAVCLHDANYTVNKDGFHNLSKDESDTLMKSMIDWGNKYAYETTDISGKKIKSLKVPKWKTSVMKFALEWFAGSAWENESTGNSKFVMPMAVSRWK